MTRRHVTVALSGDGGDELFAGYPALPGRVGGRIVRSAAGRPARPAGGKFWQRLPASPRQKSLVRQFKRFAEGIGQPGDRRYFEWMSIFNEAQRASLYSEDFVARLPDSDPYEFVNAAFRRVAGRDAISKASLADLVTYLPCDLMTKVDIASMAHGLECRAPFLDHRVVELAAAMPASLKYRSGTRQANPTGRVRSAAAQGNLDALEDGIRRAAGTLVPARTARIARDVLLDPATLARGYFQPAAVERLVEDHLAGVFNHGLRLWSLLVFELWQRQWVDVGAVATR